MAESYGLGAFEGINYVKYVARSSDGGGQCVRCSASGHAIECQLSFGAVGHSVVDNGVEAEVVVTFGKLSVEARKIEFAAGVLLAEFVEFGGTDVFALGKVDCGQAHRIL